MNIPTLDGLNWGQFSIHLQATACILDCWDTTRGDILGMNPKNYDLLTKPTPLGAQATTMDIAAYM